MVTVKNTEQLFEILFFAWEGAAAKALAAKSCSSTRASILFLGHAFHMEF
jgi:hypothetical protein